MCVCVCPCVYILCVFMLWFCCVCVCVCVVCMCAHVCLCICSISQNLCKFSRERDDFHCNYMNPQAHSLCQAVGFHKCLMKEIKKKKKPFPFRALFIIKSPKSLWTKHLLFYSKLPSQHIKSDQNWQGTQTQRGFTLNPCFYVLNRKDWQWRKVSSTWHKCSLFFFPLKLWTSNTGSWEIWVSPELQLLTLQF